MNGIKLLLLLLISSSFFSSCTNDHEIDQEISLEQLVSQYDVWYVDYHKTTGSGDIPYVSRAFTLSFLNGILYANNNIVDIGITGNGLGISVGSYYTRRGLLQTDHELDGENDFEVSQISSNEIRLYSSRENVSYYLIGYQRNEFDYDALFYENIEYFLQEYVAWEKTSRSVKGNPTGFDEEIFLQFTPENITTFYSSIDPFGTDIDNLQWDFAGDYEVFDVNGYDDLKILTLNYEVGDIEEFELSIVDDQQISLYHIASGATYNFLGRSFIQYLKEGKTKSAVRNNGRKRIKIKRKTKNRRKL